MNTGEAFVQAGAAPGEWSAAGDVMNTASRLQTAAPPMGVVVGRLSIISTVLDGRSPLCRLGG